MSITKTLGQIAHEAEERDRARVEPEIVRDRLQAALADAGRSALGMPGAVDTFTDWLARHGLRLTST